MYFRCTKSQQCLDPILEMLPLQFLSLFCQKLKVMYSKCLAWRLYNCCYCWWSGWCCWCCCEVCIIPSNVSLKNVQLCWPLLDKESLEHVCFPPCQRKYSYQAHSQPKNKDHNSHHMHCRWNVVFFIVIKIKI